MSVCCVDCLSPSDQKHAERSLIHLCSLCFVFLQTHASIDVLSSTVKSSVDSSVVHYTNDFRVDHSDAKTSSPSPPSSSSSLQSSQTDNLSGLRSFGTLKQSDFPSLNNVMRTRQWVKGIVMFNDCHFEAIQYLSQCGLLSANPSTREIVHFLRSCPALNLKSIGEYLGKNKELNIKVLEEYVESFEMKGKSLLLSLRMFLQAFRLPGESQQIGRIMEVSMYVCMYVC